MTFFKEFKAPIIFLAKFLVLYLILNLFYGLYINYYYPLADPITLIVTQNTDWVLNIIGYSTSVNFLSDSIYVRLEENGQVVLSVYEGCNGLNVMIIFISFLLAFGRPERALLWFIPLGLFIIHLSNLLRISLLFYVTKYMEQYLYFTHKYLFTAVIYAAVFIMWYIWLTRISESNE